MFIVYMYNKLIGIIQHIIVCRRSDKLHFVCSNQLKKKIIDSCVTRYYICIFVNNNLVLINKLVVKRFI